MFHSPSATPRSRGAIALAIFGLIVVSSCVAQAAPNITNLSLRGLQIGEPTRVVITGSELSAETRLVTPLPIASQQVQPGAQPNQITIEVVIDPAAAPGVYPVRVATESGISNAVAVGVDRLPQIPFAEQVEQLPVALHGNLAGAQILSTRFTGQAGQRVVVDVEGQRLGSKLNPVVRLYDSRRRQLAWSPSKLHLAGDARLETLLPADGEYTVELHDTVYRGANPGFFRLKIGDLQYADLVFPMGVQRGHAASLLPLGPSLSDSGAIDFQAAENDFRSRQPASLPNAPAVTGGRPAVVVSDAPEVVEDGSAPQPQTLPAAPAAINGTLAKPGEEDVYRVPVEPGRKLRFDVLADRIGSSLDGILMIRGEQGNQLARNDDQAGTPDPGLEFQVPANTQHVLVAVTDLLKRGGPGFVYRLAFEPVDRPDFSLALESDRLNLPAAATEVMPLTIARRGYAGPIHLDIQDLPVGVEVAGTEIPAGATRGLLTFSATPQATGPALLRIVGRSEQVEPPVVRDARVPDQPPAAYQPWFSDDLAFAVSGPAGVSVALAQPPAETMLLGERFPIALRFNRAPGAEGKIRVRLLTTQEMPKKTIKENNQDKQVDDVDRALRLDGDPVFAAGSSEATVNVLVPADLALDNWGLVLRAERLSADEKNVVESTTTPVIYRQPKRPFEVELTSAKDLDARAGEGDTGKLVGKVVRVTGYAKLVTVTLAGLPEGYPAPSVEVAGDQETFELPVRFPAEAKPGELKGVTLVGEAKCDFSTENAVVRSPAIALGVIRVVAAEPAKPATDGAN